MSDLRRHIMMQREIPPITSYIQDGLSLLLDCRTECTSDKWIDQINRLEYDGSNISIQNDTPYFNGINSYYRRAGGIGIDYNTGTIEMAYAPIIVSDVAYIGMFGSRGMSAFDIGYTLDLRRTLVLIQGISFDGRSSLMFGFSGTTPNKITSSITSEYAILNRNNYDLSFNNSWTGSVSGYTYIGSMAGRRFYRGTIYSIRIYNRKLTIDEILYNQQIDNQRFNLGL